MQYLWKDGARGVGKLDAQEVGDCLEKLRLRNGGVITAEVVLAEARKKRSPLHDGFEWDDTAAAHQYRLEQARSITRAVITFIGEEQDDTPIRAFVTLGGGDYESITTVLSVKSKRDALLGQALEEMRTFRRKYHHLKELATVFVAIEELTAEKEKEPV